MMNMTSGLETHKPKIIAKLIELNEGRMDEAKLESLLGKVYDAILPIPAKIFVKEKAFVEACMTKKDEFIKAVNKDVVKRTFTLIQ